MRTCERGMEVKKVLVFSLLMVGGGLAQTNPLQSSEDAVESQCVTISADTLLRGARAL